MHALINWVNAEKEKIKGGEKNALHPVELAFEFHLRYLIRSFNLVSKAIAGKAIEEPDDLDKKLQLLERELSGINPDDEVKMKYSLDTFMICYETWIGKFLVLAIPVIQKFNKFFTGTNHHISLTQAGVYVYFINQPVLEIKDQFESGIQRQLERIEQQYQELRIQTSYGNLVKGGLKSFGCNYSITIKFDEIKYDVFVDDFNETNGDKITIKKYERLLHQPLIDEEMNDVANILGNAIFKHIDYYTKKNGLRH